MHTAATRRRGRRLEEVSEEETLKEQEEEEKRLVEEVLRDFPPEERGEREEWADQVGWHRKENIRKGRRDDDQVNVKEGKDDASKTNPEKALRSRQRAAIGDSSQSSKGLSFPILTLSSILLVIGFIISRMLRKRNKDRTL